MALPSSSLTDPGTTTNSNANEEFLAAEATLDTSKLTDYLKKVSLNALLSYMPPVSVCR